MENKIVGFLVAALFIGMGSFYLFRTRSFVERSISNGDKSHLGKGGFWGAMKSIIASNQYALSFKVGGILLIVAGVALLGLLIIER